MDRVEFLHSIRGNDADESRIVTEFFNQFMFLYDMANEYDVRYIECSDFYAAFHITCKNKNSSLEPLVRKLENHQTIVMYERTYQVTITYQDKKSVDVSITR